MKPAAAEDGSIVDISLTVSPVRNPEGKLRASKIARDITERSGQKSNNDCSERWITRQESIRN